MISNQKIPESKEINNIRNLKMFRAEWHWKFNLTTSVGCCYSSTKGKMCSFMFFLEKKTDLE